MTDIVEQAQNEYERFERVLGDTSLELIAEIESLRKQLTDLEDDEQKAVERCVIAEQRLVECQARERATREAAIEVAACTTPINRNAELARLKKAMPLIIQPQNSTALDQAIRQALKDEELNGWKRVVIDGLVVAHILTKEHEADPRKALNDLICWSNDVALDPAVSSDAANLKKKWQREALLDAANWFDTAVYGVHYLGEPEDELIRMAKELE